MWCGSKVTLEIRLIGPFRMLRDGAPLDALTQRQMALLALLALHANQALDKKWVIEQLWPKEGRGMSLLNKLVQDVLEALHPFDPELSPKDGILRLDTAQIFVDVAAFDSAWKQRQAEPAGLARAVERVTGPLLQDWEHWYAPEWAAQARKKYAHRYREALVWLAGHALDVDHCEGARTYLAALREIGDAAEELHRRMMELLVAAERYVLAGQLYEEYRIYVRESRGQLPPRAMTELYTQIPRPAAGFAVRYEPQVVEEEPVGGGMPLDSRYYIARPSDILIHTAVKRRDGIVRIEGPRQTGKTSLLARALEQARQEGAKVVITDFQALGPEDMATIGSLFLALAQQFYRAVKPAIAPTEYWDVHLSANMNFEGYLSEVILGETGVPVVWGIDEADRIFDRDYRSSVFGLFRSWHNKRSLTPDAIWRRFTLIMAYAAEARTLIPNPHESPFNVGTGTMLQDFTAEQVAELNDLYAGPITTAQALARLTALVGGHPYLVRRSLYELKTRPATVQEIEAQSLQDNGLFAEHLDRIRRAVTHNPERRQAVTNLLRGKPCEDLDTFARLRSAGVLIGEAMPEARFRCGLYEGCLKKHLL